MSARGGRAAGAAAVAEAVPPTMVEDEEVKAQDSASERSFGRLLGAKVSKGADIFRRSHAGAVNTANASPKIKTSKSSESLRRTVSISRKDSLEHNSLGRSSTRVVAAIPTAEWVSLKKRKGDGDEPALELPPLTIHPYGKGYRNWMIFMMLAAMFTGLFVPYVVAFDVQLGLHPYGGAKWIITYILMVIFTMDLVIGFRVAFFDHEMLITDSWDMAEHYLKRRFIVDFLAWFPFDIIAMAMVDKNNLNAYTDHYLYLLELLRMLRMYRIWWFIQYMEYNLAVSLLIVTLVRNFVICLYATHWAACIFYYMAVQEGPPISSTWLGVEAGVAAGMTEVQLYVLSCYWSMTTLATVGYGDWHPATTAEMVFVTGYMIFDVFLNAYILGTITLTVIKHDERLGFYRQRCNNLKRYANINHIPSDLEDGMLAHLRLNFSNEQASDETVLSSYPTAIRRRILRHLYANEVRTCYLFSGTRQKYVDALLAVARIELFMPKVEVVAEGDHIHELYVVVSGTLTQVSADPSQRAEDLALDVDGLRSVHGHKRTLLYEGDTFAEIAFFTEVPQANSVRTVSMCRILVVPRTAYAAVAVDFPIGARTVLENLKQRAQSAVDAEFRSAESRVLLQRSPMEHVKYDFASAETVGGADTSSHGGNAYGASVAKGCSWLPGNGKNCNPEEEVMSAAQKRVLANLQRVQQLVTETVAKQDEARVDSFLSAAARGDTGGVRMMLQQGFAPDSSDYDGRTALMLASGKGHREVALMLLGANADPNLKDSLGGNALMEASKHGHDDIIELLQSKGAMLGLTPVEAATRLCSCVFDGDLSLLKRYLMAGIDVNAGDYDKRAALHIAACEGVLATVRLLVEEGKADVNVRDRWGATPLDEALRTGHPQVAAYLRNRGAETYKELERITEFLNAAARGEDAQLRHMLQNSYDPNCMDYDKRTALMVAVAGGHTRAVNTLLGGGADLALYDSMGENALSEAVRSGHDNLIPLLVQNGAKLGWDGPNTLYKLGNAARSSGDIAMLKRYLSAGADPNASNFDQRTALHIAASHGNLEAVRVLVDAGAALSARDNHGSSPLDEATRKGHIEVARFLKAAANRPIM